MARRPGSTCRVVVIDAASLTGYTAGSDTIGGAEASLAAVAAGLAGGSPGEQPAGIDVSVVVTKLPRSFASCIDGVAWRGIGWPAWRDLRRADVVVVQRQVALLVVARLVNPRARLLVWYHDWYFAPADELRSRVVTTAKALLRTLLHRSTGAVGVAVSHTHAANLHEHLALAGRVSRPVRLEVVNNPVDQPDPRPDIEVDPDKLIFFSAAWKGLDQVLDAFAVVHRALPTLRLYVASPGYSAHVPDLQDVELHDDALHYLGYLTHDELFAHVQSALCVFYPADLVPETFGLVFLESHAVGTPVLAHPFGAAVEFLSDDEQVDARDLEAIVQTLRAWRAGGRPVVSGDRSLGVDATVARWRRLLVDDHAVAASERESGR